jgi:hypothetical protein
MDSTPFQNTHNENKRLHFEWVIPTFFHPGKTLQKVVEREKPVWITPLLILSVLVILTGLIAGPLRQAAIVNGSSLPADFQYYSSSQQALLIEAQSTQSSPLFTYIFPMVTGILGIWLSWFILSSLLHLILTLSGSRASSVHSYNLVAWTMLPLAIRSAVQIATMLFSHSLISGAGLSGFIIANSTFTAYLEGILTHIDLYFIWQICLLLYGVLPLSRLVRAKAWIATFISLLIYLMLVGLPQMISSLFSGISFGGFYF